MNDSKTPLSVHFRLPSSFARPPEFELDCRTLRNNGVPAVKTILEKVRCLGTGQILLIRIDFMPTLLCRIMANRGFKHWSESAENGEWNIYFLKEARLRPGFPA